jgi:hypothetical protein
MVYGSAETLDGAGLPVTIDTNVGLADKAGIEPSRLDTAIDGLVKLCEDGARVLDDSSPMVEAYMRRLSVEAAKALKTIEDLSAAEGAGEAAIPGINDMLARTLDIVSKITTIQEKVSKMLVNAVKAKDVAIRLRTFIATGDEEDHGLEDMSENALRRLINATASGDQLPREERRG